MLGSKSSLFIAVITVASLLGPNLAISDPSDFYKGKTIEILVGFPPGGGYDAYSRALAQRFGTHVPGNPLVVVRNMTGAESLRLANYLQSAAPRDGLSFGTIDNGLEIATLIKPDVKFNASKLQWIGSITRDLEICATWHTAAARTLDEMKSKETVFGATGHDDIRYTSTEVLRKLTNSKIKVVTGYAGTADIRVALENGEIQGVCDSWQGLKATKPEWISNHKLNIVVQLGAKKHPDLPDVPLISEFARTEEERAAIGLLFSVFEAGRPFGAPPGVPTDRIQALRRAFDATMQDPEFIALTKRQRLEVDPITGEEMNSFLKKIYAYPRSTILLAQELIK